MFFKHYIQLNKLTFTAAVQMGESKVAEVHCRQRQRQRNVLPALRLKPDTSSHCSHTTAIPGNIAGPVLSPELPSSDIPPQTCQKR